MGYPQELALRLATSARKNNPPLAHLADIKGGLGDYDFQYFIVLNATVGNRSNSRLCPVQVVPHLTANDPFRHVLELTSNPLSLRHDFGCKVVRATKNHQQWKV